MGGILTGIYPILDAARLACWPVEPAEVARAMAPLAIGCVQLRCKGDRQTLAAFAAPWMVALRRFAPHIKIIINDEVALALALAADGVHVGQTDQGVGECRRLLGAHRIIGVSTHTLQEIHQGLAHGADYVGFGPIFATTSKGDAQATQGVTQLGRVCQASPLPVVAIGGISPEGVSAIAQAGAAGAAMISGLWDHDWRHRLTLCTNLWHHHRPA